MRFNFTGSTFAAFLLVVPLCTPNAAMSPQPVAAAANAATAPTAASVAIASARVGRITLVEGKVEYRGPGEAQWTSASINDPIATGVVLRTQPRARTEIRVGADTIDLGEATEIAFVRLDQPFAEIAVKAGRIGLDLSRLNPGESVEIDVAAGGVWLLGNGRYDISDDGDLSLQVTAFTGRARFAGKGADLPIAPGHRVLLSAARPVAGETEAADADDFARWCATRAINDEQQVTPYFVSRSLTGYEALDGAGDWRIDDKDGALWTPKARPADWAPYRTGHWRWLFPWGWSWVDDQPWGFATAHYGRWLLADGHWSWAPGPFVEHPIWAPAVVAFLGTPGVGLSYADGPGPAIAWFPLAPGEVYWPSYTRDLDYIRAINRGDTPDLNRIHYDAEGEPASEIDQAHFANRISANVVPRMIFVTGQEVAGNLLMIPKERLENAPAIMGSPQIGPSPPVRVAAGPASSREHANSPSAGKPGRSAVLEVVRAAAFRLRSIQTMVRLRLDHLRLAHTELSRTLRHAIVLRVSRADHGAAANESHARIIRR